MFFRNKICQDPLENLFGQQRGRMNENPNAGDFVKNTQALDLAKCESWQL